jgi:hypothetical protein
MGKPDVDVALAEVESKLTFPQWLNVNPEAKESFWEFVEQGERRGLPFSRVVEKWREFFPDAPHQEASNTKEWVKRERNEGRR